MPKDSEELARARKLLSGEVPFLEDTGGSEKIRLATALALVDIADSLRILALKTASRS